MEQAILFPVFAEEYLNLCKKSTAYKESLRNAVNHLQRFSNATQIPVFTNLGEQVMEDFAYYLQSQNLMTSTIKNNVNRIKYLLKKAHRAGYETDRTIEDFNVPDEEANGNQRLLHYRLFDGSSFLGLFPSTGEKFRPE